MNPLRTVPLQPRSFLQRLFRQLPPDNAIREVNNLLAGRQPSGVSRADMAAIEQRYLVSLAREYRLNLEELYAVFLAEALSDQVYTGGEQADMQHLAEVLGLPQDRVKPCIP